MRPVRQRAGLTMIEVLIAIIVILIAVLSAVSTQLTSLNLMSTSRGTNAATGELRAAMEEILALQLSRIPEDHPMGQDMPAYRDRILPEQRIVPTYPGLVDPEDPPNPLTIQLTITWNDAGSRQTRSETLTTMKSR